MNDLYLNTPLTKAIFEAFKELSEEISFILEDAAPGSCRAYVFGGAAVHIYTNARGSGDIDTELQAAQKMELEEIIIRYEDEEGNEQSVSIDPNFSTGISGMLADDYQECAVPLMIDKAAPLHVYLVSPLHLAVHKLDRLAEGDQDDIISLASAGRISAETLEQEGVKVLSYAIGAQSRLKANLSYMIRELKKRGL